MDNPGFHVNGRMIEDPEAFRYRIASLSIGAKASLDVVRDGKTRTITIDLIAPPEEPLRRETIIKGRNPARGVTLANISPAVLDELGLPSDTREGVIVITVEPGTTAVRVGFVPGDIIVNVNGRGIKTVRDAVEAFGQTSRQWRLIVRRGNRDITMVLGG